ncbi:hypothetical protein FA15DRAFT_691294 [Coprinopsis marcescibilis]|uniref:Uncharacterized protein n=1 Tax=Coprinopsis marcescibilis TaxID=230819 RepID=A0A5C3L8Q7_COPMA|nr:hypothetical protein FA15DRAFT_691294 [Coprinopsis marcescibilis]
MSAPRMHRDMSYRKPVPKYEPTPPSSPVPSPYGCASVPHPIDIPSAWCKSQPGEYYAEGPFDVVVPSFLISQPVPVMPMPMPCTAIEIVVNERAQEAQFKTHTSLNEPLTRYATPVEKEEIGEGLTAGKAQKRRIHTTYRPPTPPLPALHKRRRLTATYQVDDDNTLPPKYTAEDSDRAPRNTSIRTMPSFSTEKTFISVTSPSGSNTSSGRTTAASNYPLDSNTKLRCMKAVDIRSEHTPRDMFQVDLKTRVASAEAPSISEQLGGTLLELHAQMKRIGSVLCCF